MATTSKSSDSSTQTEGENVSTSYDSPAVTAVSEEERNKIVKKDEKAFPDQTVAPAGVQNITADRGKKTRENETETERLDRIRREADGKQREENQKRIDSKARKALRVENGVTINEAVQLD